ncbi:MAG: hypothetical protein K0U42_03215 [Actinomycetia bacterium]|jgi:hypothetical protein|nr:hypothetical protein [Actinomycetes bacterium]
MTNTNSIHWATMRQRDVVAGFGFFVFFNTALLALIVLGSDVLGHDGSHDAKVGFGIIAVAINLMLWIWNDSAIVDVQSSSKDIAGADLETAIGQKFVKAPWAMYRVLVLVITVLVTGSIIYGVFW